MKGSGNKTRHRHDASKSLVGFLVADVHYALPVGCVREISRPLRMVELPRAPPAVVGVAEYRGEVVPVIDLRARFGCPASPQTPKTKWVVAIVATRTIALVVDAVTEVFGTSGAGLRPAPELGREDGSRGIAAVTNHQGLVFVLDASRLAELADGLTDDSRLGSGTSLVPGEGRA